jgi:hypothetical protein
LAQHGPAEDEPTLDQAEDEEKAEPGEENGEE